MKKVFITGSSGFVGSNLLIECAKKNIECIAGSRKLYGDLVKQDHWETFLTGCDVVVHLAARVHVMDETDSDPLSAFRKTNVEATLKIARAAKKSGIKRFIYISSIKVNGEFTYDKPFSSSDTPNPQDPYGISKMEAEQELLKLQEDTIFEIVIIRPPLIYGPGVKANFEKLLRLVQKNIPLPFGSVHNKRSLVSVYNLCSLIINCFDNPAASGEIFLVSDDHDYSLKALIGLMAGVSNKKPILLPIPVSLMNFTAKILSKQDYADRLFGNLHVDIYKTKSLLNWQPPVSFRETYSQKN
ncbi:MAG: SDR family oxidoreductase [Bacteriovorax sp.]|nr:SDR family oxidoreductase [Bacteriovorax sp.]